MGKNKNKNRNKKEKELVSSAISIINQTSTNNNSNNSNNVSNSNNEKQLPFVSVCTPTFNRRPFIPYMIKCFQQQDYPMNRIEWIIVDDGTDKIGDLVKDIPQVKYISFEKKMLLGNKRNIMHKKCKGDIIVYMDDDDYYPPERISHAVSMLLKTPKALCAGSSEIYIYFKHIQKMYQFGPYKDTHSTAGTFAFRKELLNITRYEDNAALAEEKHFLKNYTIPFVQLDPIKTILVFSHPHNTFDKRRLLENINPDFTKESKKKVDMFIKDADIRDFYMNRIELLLKTYEPGRPNMKPDVLSQMVSIERERRKEIEKLQSQQTQNGPTISLSQGDGPPQVLTMEQVVNILQQQQAQIIHLTNLLQGKDTEIKILTEALSKTQLQNHVEC